MARKFLYSIQLTNGAVQAVSLDTLATADLPTTLPASVGAGNSGAANDASLLGGTGFKTGISVENAWIDMSVVNGSYEGILVLQLINPSAAPAAGAHAVAFDCEMGTAPGNSRNFGFHSTAQVINAHQGTGTIGDFECVEGTTENVSTGSVTDGFVFSANIINSGGGTWSNAYGVYVTLNNGPGTITSGYGVFVKVPANSGTWHNCYGIYIADQSAVGDTNSYNLYSAGTGKNYLGGPITTDGQFSINTAGKGISIKTGTNAKMGTGTLSGGTATISTTAVTANSLIFLSDQGGGVLANIGSLSVGTITAGTSFVVNSSNALDSSNFAWLIIEKA